MFGVLASLEWFFPRCFPLAPFSAMQRLALWQTLRFGYPLALNGVLFIPWHWTAYYSSLGTERLTIHPLALNGVLFIRIVTCSLAWRRRRLNLALLWKLMHGHGPPALRAQLPTRVSVRAKQSLHRDTLAMPLCRTQRRLQSFLPSTVALWNSLPSSVLSCTSVSSFLVSLDSHLISDCYSLGL